MGCQDVRVSPEAHRAASVTPHLPRRVGAGRFAPGPLRAEAHFGGGAVSAGTGSREGLGRRGVTRDPPPPTWGRPRDTWDAGASAPRTSSPAVGRHVSGTLPRGAACGGDGAWGGCPALASDREQRALASAPPWTPAPRGLGAGRGPWSAHAQRVPPPSAGSARRGARGSATPRPPSRTARWLFVGASPRRPTRPDARAASGSSPPRGACVAHQQRFH